MSRRRSSKRRGSARRRRPRRRDGSLDVAIVGAGPAGVGVAVALASLGLRARVIERERIGSSFTHWPRQMRFITPSFPSNGFGLPDLNGPAPGTSPAFSMGVEHPTGMEYARYLEGIARHFSLPVATGAEVRAVRRDEHGFTLDVSGRSELSARFVVWAAGEYREPRVNGFPGAELCLHTGQVGSWDQLPEEDHLVIGGYESGIDAASELSERGRRVTVLDGESRWRSAEGDPSLDLSPVTKARLSRARAAGKLDLRRERVVAVERTAEGRFLVRGERGGEHRTSAPPLLASGFAPVLAPVDSLLERREDGYPLLSAADESTLAPGLFLAGPSVRHDDAILCFVYKFRTRIPVVAREIATRKGVDPAPLEAWREANMWVENLSGCGEGCEC